LPALNAAIAAAFESRKHAGRLFESAAGATHSNWKENARSWCARLSHLTAAFVDISTLCLLVATLKAQVWRLVLALEA
jgi:hypothetical protein